MSAQQFFSRTKAWVNSSLYAQMLFVALAFALMVIASYIFVSDIERNNLRAKVKDVISYTEANIKADMLEPETALAAIAETIHGMILSKEEIETVRGYIHHINDYMQDNEKNRLAGVVGFYGFFDIYGGKYFTERKEDWIPPEGYVLQERPWYQAAVKADGDIGITEPYSNIRMGDLPIITFSRCIFDEDGKRLGIICLDIKLDRIRQHAINTQFTKKGYGFLLSRELELIAHPLPSILGMRLNEVKSRIAGYEDKLKQNGHISEVITTDYRGIESIVFIKELQNGWYMGVVTPRNEYYQSTRNLAKILATLGTALAMILIIILVRISTEKNRSDERMRIIFNAMPLGANIHNRNFDFFDCNENAVNLFGLSNKQEYLEKFYQLSPKYQPDGELSNKKMAEYIDKAFTDGYCRFEWIHQKLNGEPIPCEITLVRAQHNDGYIVVKYIRDLREQKEMLAKIHKENEKSRTMAHWYNSILNAIPLPITVTDTDTKWTFINAAVEKHLGITLEEAIGKPCSNWGANICNTPYCGIACAKRGLKQTYFSEGDSSYQIDVAVLKDLNDKTMGYIEVVQDITNLKMMTKKQADAEAANIAKSAFLAKVSHEIRTPMNAILGITEIQLQNEKLSPDTQEALGVIYNSGYLLLGIINDILDLSKIEAGKLELVPINYDVPSLINDIVHLNVMRYDSKPIEFKLQVDENIPTSLFGDELRIKQILNNLLSNAFKYTESGEVSLSVAFEAQQGENAGIMLVFRVSDTGQGMTTEQLNKLFDEYTRFNIEANRTTVGTGLGMAITKYLVRMMNGAILVESKPGKGSTFTVRLPQGVVAQSGVLGKELAKNLGLFSLGRAAQMKKAPQIIREYMPYGRILIVDDVETNLYVAKGLMAPYGLSVETAMSGFETIEKIKDGSIYDIIFMDHFMPKMDGIETTKNLRELGYTRPIVALTANALTGQAEMFVANGFDGFISKPIDLRQLNTTLNRLIRDKYPVETIETARHLKDNLKKSPANGNSANNNSVNAAPHPSIDPELAKIFTRDAEKAAATLEEIQKKEGNYGDEDIQTYTIYVHAMKSALANIGETALSESALKLELAGRARNTAVMTAETPAFLNSLRTLIGKINPG